MYDIYEIKCLMNDKCYYGRSQEVEKRWRAHVNMLRKGDHSNSTLQSDWNSCGEGNFAFKVIANFDDIQRSIDAEQQLIDLNSGGYNISNATPGGDTFTNNPRKEEIRALHSKLSSGERNPMYGVPKSEKMIASVKEANSKKISAEGIIFDSMTQAARYFKCSISGVSFKVKSPKYQDWFLVTE